MSKGKGNGYLLTEVKKVEAPNFTMNAAELYAHLPEGVKFIIKRVYWLSGAKNERKSGQHAHTDEDEVFIVIKGSATILLDGEGKKIKKNILNENAAVWVPRYTWHGFEKISKDCMILALSSTNYDPERKGYVTDYQEFKKIKSK